MKASADEDLVCKNVIIECTSEFCDDEENNLRMMEIELEMERIKNGKKGMGSCSCNSVNC